MSDTKMIPVASSHLRAIGYSESGKLYIEFKDKSLYVYEGVPVELWERFKESESKGQFFQNEIKGEYNGKCLGKVGA